MVGEGRGLLDKLGQCLYNFSSCVASCADDQDCGGHFWGRNGTVETEIKVVLNREVLDREERTDLPFQLLICLQNTVSSVNLKL